MKNLMLSEHQPLVSVILPTYNRPNYLREAIASAISQTYKNIEIIVSDNCSPVNPQYLIEEFNDSRIKFYRQDSNIGSFMNVMSAFSRAEGKYVACLLDDDIWEDNYLSQMVPVLEKNSDAVLAFCDHYMTDESGKIDFQKSEKCSRFYGRNKLSQKLYRPFYELSVVSQSVTPAFAAVMRRDAIDWQAIPSDVGLLWDTYLAYLYSATGEGAYYVPARLTRCREHDQTITKQSGSRNVDLKLAKAEGEIFCCQIYIADERLAYLRPYFQRQLAHHLATSGIALIKKKDMTEARIRFQKALQISPSIRTICAFMLSFTPNIFLSRLR